jgi:hypothetical protein
MCIMPQGDPVSSIASNYPLTPPLLEKPCNTETMEKAAKYQTTSGYLFSQ